MTLEEAELGSRGEEERVKFLRELGGPREPQLERWPWMLTEGLVSHAETVGSHRRILIRARDIIGTEL